MAGLFGAIARNFKRNGQSDGVNRDGMWFSSPSATGVQVNQQTALSVTAVMACASIISEDVAKLTPRLVRKDARGRKIEIAAQDHPIARLLKRPNDWQTYFEWSQMMVVGLLLRGNAYSVILRNRRGQPVMLVPINPDRVHLWEAPHGGLFWVISRTGLHELNILKDMPLLIPYEDVLHWKLLSSNGLLGVSKIALNREAIGLASGLEQMAAYTVGNGAFMNGTLQSDKKTSKEVMDRLRTQWEQQKAGILNAGRPLFLEDGIKWNPFKLSFTDMQFMLARGFQIEEIARIWRVPVGMLQVMIKGGTNHLTEQSQAYLNECLMTYVTLIEQRWDFTFGMDIDSDMAVELDLSKVLRGDMQARATWYKSMFQIGAFTPNEIRRAEGMDPDHEANSDKLFRPANMVPIDSDVAAGLDLPGLGSDQTGEQAPGGGRPNSDGTEAAPSD
jgi:HK97 family phage portal protein